MSEPEGFRIDTPEKAAWALGKYAGLHQRRDQNNDLAAREHERVRLWQEQANASIGCQMEFYEAHLEVFAMKQRIAGVKTFDSPSGKIKSRATSQTIEVDNKDAVIEWAQVNNRDDLLRFSVSLNLPNVKSSFVTADQQVIDPSTGEAIPGLSPVAERISFSIEPNLDMADLGDLEDE